jgi:hypothetical protein
MGEYPLDATFNAISGFWPFGKPEEVFTGTLSAQKGRVRLLSAPSYSRFDDVSKVVREVSQRGTLTNREPPRISSITGFTRQGHCTLLNAIVGEGDGITDFSSRQKVAATLYQHGSVVMGLHLESLEAESLDSAGLFYTKIHHVLPTPWTFIWEEDKRTFVSPSSAKEVFRFCSLALQAEIVCEVFADAPLHFTRGAKIKPVPRLRIIPSAPKSAPKSLKWFLSVVDRLENFFTLFLGTSVALRKVQLFQGDNIGWLVQQRRRPRNEKVNPQTWVRTQSHDEWAGALARWLAVPDEKRPVEKILLGMMRRISVFVETEFLSLAQALEGFGRIRFDDKLADKSSFHRRLEQSYGLLSPDFALDLLEERDKFARTVVQTRNYFTHPGIPRNGSKLSGWSRLSHTPAICTNSCFASGGA